MYVVIAVLIFYVGASIGSFLNVVIDRIPGGKSIVSPPSHCDNCGRRLGIRELIPVFSYIWLRGKCRACGARIPVRVLLVEIGTGLLFLLLLQRYGLSPEFGVICLYSCVFIVLSAIDLKHGILPNSVIYPAMPLALLLYILVGQNMTGLNSNFFQWNLGPSFVPVLLNSLMGGAASFVLLLVVVIVSRGGMGMGDVKLAGLIGLMTGFPLALIALFITIILAGIVAAVLLLTRIRKRRDPVPFGPFLCLGALIAMIWGRDMIIWYLGIR